MDLKIPEFLCDGGLAPHLEKYEMLNNLNGYYFTGILGRPGSGKTSFLVSLLTGKKKDKVFRKVFNNLYLIMPSSSRHSMKKNIFKNHDESKMFDDLTLSNLNDIYNKLEISTLEDESSLLILDDVGASLKNLSIQTLLRKLIYNRRHLKCHIIILLQSFMSVPKEVRKLFNNLIVFKPSKIEFETLCEEIFEMNRDNALQLMNYVYKEPHDYLFLNCLNRKMYKDFNEIILKTDDDDN
jgi:ABC-type branched-subunit amino acid transport system ATPase component